MREEFRALAAQSVPRIIVKGAISLLVVGLAALISREGIACAAILILTGVTGPTIRLVTMKTAGIYERITVSAVTKPRFFLTFAGVWSTAVVLPLLPAIALILVLRGPVVLIPVLTGTVLSVVLGTLCGVVSRGLSEAHLAALLASGLLMGLSFIRTPVSVYMPFTFLAMTSFEPGSMIFSILLTVAALVALAFTVSRS